jgi:hypothetical protein
MSSHLHTPTSPRRWGAGVAAGLCLALAGTGVATAASGPSRASQIHVASHRAQLASGRLAYRVRALEAHGYVQTSCTVNGTRMTNPGTGRSVTLTW